MLILEDVMTKQKPLRMIGKATGIIAFLAVLFVMLRYSNWYFYNGFDQKNAIMQYCSQFNDLELGWFAYIFKHGVLNFVADTKSDKYNTELNNVNMIGLNVVSYSSGIAPAVVAYGKSTLNNVNLYGTKLSELDTNPAWHVWDLALVNYTTTNINNSKVGSIYTWAKTSITISNSEVDTIYSQSRKTSDMTTGGLTVENNSKVNKIVVANKNAIINIKSGSVVDTIDFNGLDKTNMTIIIEDGATVNNQIN
jgi:hypothetical protein